MKLLCDDRNQVYVWVDDDNEDIHLSPRFDYEEDAENWYKQIKKKVQDEKNLL